MAKAVIPRDAERVFDIGELFFSTTDKRGVITAGNDVFVRVSGYTLEELLGSPHNIIRHPDIPRAVFMLLWQYIQGGKSIAAYVKNMAKDGRYYWVMAVVAPTESGYLSIRLKPSSAFFPIVQAIYAELLEIERRHGGGKELRQAGMEAAAARLMEILAANGFDSYDSFMHVALVEEMRCRDRELDRRAGERLPRRACSDRARARVAFEPPIHDAIEHCTSIQRHFVSVFHGLEDYSLLNDRLSGKSQFILELSQSISRLSLNATIESARLHEQGACLSVIAEWMRGTSRDIFEAIHTLSEQITAVSGGLTQASYEIAESRLNIEMMAFFLSELTARVGNDLPANGSGTRGQHPKADPPAGPNGTEARQHVRELAHAFSLSARGTVNVMAALKTGLDRLAQQLDQVLLLIRTLGFAHVIGKIEAARLSDPVAFESIFDEVLAMINDARGRLEELIQAITAIEMKPIRDREVEAFLAAVK